jgi:hypothetical protein
MHALIGIRDPENRIADDAAHSQLREETEAKEE